MIWSMSDSSVLEYIYILWCWRNALRRWSPSVCLVSWMEGRSVQLAEISSWHWVLVGKGGLGIRHSTYSISCRGARRALFAFRSAWKGRDMLKWADHLPSLCLPLRPLFSYSDEPVHFQIPFNGPLSLEFQEYILCFLLRLSLMPRNQRLLQCLYKLYPYSM